MTEPAVERESPGVWGAVRSHSRLVAIVIILFFAVGLAAGVRRHAKYSATANLAVLHLNFGGSSGSLSAFSTAAPILADTYARAITADGVVDPLASQFHTSASKIRDDLSASSVPANPTLMVTAKTTSKKTAIALANAAMAQLVTYLGGVNGSDPGGASLYTELKQAEASLAARQNKLQAVTASINHAMQASHAVSMSGTQQAQLAAAQSSKNLAADKVASLNAAYTQARLNSANTQYLQPLQSATSAKSDRASRLVLYAFVGLVVGIALATGIAVLLQGRALKKLRAA
jgi:capsular polysaccharide biosynthesis protein